MILYHISTNIRKDGHFQPRAPHQTMEGENRVRMRVSASPTMADCFTALPGGSYQLFSLNSRQEGFYKVFRIDTDELGISEKDILTPTQLMENGWVPDAGIANEHWITVPFLVPEEESFVLLLTGWRERVVEMAPVQNASGECFLYANGVNVIDSIVFKRDSFKVSEWIQHYGFLKEEEDFRQIMASAKREYGIEMEMVNNYTLQVKEGELTMEQLAFCTFPVAKALETAQKRIAI